MKRNILIFLVLILITSFFNYFYKDINLVWSDNIKSLTLKQVASLLYLSKQEVISKLGEDYEFKGVGYEGTSDGYYYKKLGILLIMANYPPKNKYCVYRIDCDKSVDINGARAGMMFDEIQKILGKAEIKEDFGENSKEYILRYKIGNIYVSFKSRNISGLDSVVYIFGVN